MLVFISETLNQRDGGLSFMRIALLIIACIIAPLHSACAILPSVDGIEFLGQYVLLDTENRTAQQILHAPGFSESPYGHLIRTASDTDHIWVKWEIEIKQPLSFSPVVFLEYPFPRFQSGMKAGYLYVAANGTIIASTRQDKSFESFLLPLPPDLPAGRYELLFSIQSSLHHYPFVPVLTSKSEIRLHQNRELVTTLPAIGFIGGIVLLGLFLFIQMRDSLFLWFSVCYTFESFRIALLHYPLPLFPAFEQLPHLSDQLLLTFGLISYYLFMRQLLSLHENTPRLNRMMQLMCLLLLVILPWQLLNPGFERCLATFYFSLPLSLFLLSALIKIIRNKSITPQWMPWGWLVTTSGYLLVFIASLFIKTATIRNIYNISLLIMCIETFLFGIYSGYKVRELKVQNSESRWEALHAQLNPHFVFNVMNNLGGLDSLQKVDRITADFAEFLRYILTSRLKKTVPLCAEIEALHHYIAMDSIRFDEEAEVSFNIPDTLQSVPIIPLLLQPLLENALKHTRAQKLVPNIGIEAEAYQKSGILLRVTNNGTWEKSSKAHGTATGIQNLQERLRLAYQGKAQLKFEHGNNFIAATISIASLS